MNRRQEAVGKNEALFREVNERIREITTDHGDAEFLCECGDPTCAFPVALGLDEYEAVRRDAAQFVIVPGHEAPDVEDVVAHNERFAIVRKRPGSPTALAAETDPRS
jgi:hypothetical protein